MKTLHKFENGLSGSDVLLVEINGQQGILKCNVNRTTEIVSKHNTLPFLKPTIYWYTDNSIFMEYIPGISIKHYLETADRSAIDRFIKYIATYFKYCIEHSTMVDYTQLVDSKLKSYKKYYNTELVFDTQLQSSVVHGDFTFDNLIVYNSEFYMIDIHATEYNSVSFDANKLRQDLSGCWFVRNEKNIVEYKLSCSYIYDILNEQFPMLFNDEIYKLMLMRILPFSKSSSDNTFLISELDRLCK